jgi:glycosyltransferase involved in cell wall biosynthesis
MRALRLGRAVLDQITPLVITLDEAPNIERTLEQLRWAHRIVVIDSGSTDGTLEIVARYPQAEVIHRPFDSFAGQCNFGLTQITSQWVLSLDADYELSDELVRELRQLEERAEIQGYRASFIYRIYGAALSGTLYPPRTVLYRARSACYVDEGHGHRVAIAGQIADLRGPIYHDDRKPLWRWLASQQRYARLEAEHLARTPKESLSRTDRIRLLAFPAPLLVLPYVLLVKGCIFNGWQGWRYALERLLAETMLALELLDRRARRATSQEI